MSITTPLLAPVTVTTAGTPVQYVDPTVKVGAPGAPGVRISPLLFKSLTFRCHSGNTGSVIIRQIVNGSMTTGYTLAKGENPLILETTVKGHSFDLNSFWLDAATNGDKVLISGVPFRE